MNRRTRIRARAPDYQQGQDPGLNIKEGERGRGALKTMDRKVETDAGRWLTFQAYMRQRGIRIFRTLKTVSVSFEDETTADECLRFFIQSGKQK